LVGHEIDRRTLLPSNGTPDITEVISKVFTVGGMTKMVYQPLTFAYPEIKEGGEDLPGMLPRPTHAAMKYRMRPKTFAPCTTGGVADRLGCIEVRVG
jgi:hypothetical protein